MRKGKMIEKVLALAVVFLFWPGCLLAQWSPTKPINLILTSAPGQSGDVTTRLLADKAEKLLGQSLMITNNNQASGAVAFGILARAKPDGHTIVATATGYLLWTPFVQRVSYKLEDYVPIMCYLAMESGVVVNTGSPWKTFKELVEYAKQNPGKVSYSVTSANAPMDLAMQYVAKREGIRWACVPTPGADPKTLLLGGHVTAHSGVTTWIPQVRSGAFRLLAVHSAKRMKDFPDVPTFRELGYDFVHESLGLVIGPKGTPEPVLKRLDDVFRQAMASEEFIARMKAFNFGIVYQSHEELAKRWVEESNAIGRLVKSLGITPEGEKK
jgi:tripartite-type tricarboxylate transporter receptor subunit TctC